MHVPDCFAVRLCDSDLQRQRHRAKIGSTVRDTGIAPIEEPRQPGRFADHHDVPRVKIVVSQNIPLRMPSLANFADEVARVVSQELNPRLDFAEMLGRQKLLLGNLPKSWPGVEVIVRPSPVPPVGGGQAVEDDHLFDQIFDERGQIDVRLTLTQKLAANSPLQHERQSRLGLAHFDRFGDANPATLNEGPNLEFALHVADGVLIFRGPQDKLIA